MTKNLVLFAALVFSTTAFPCRQVTAQTIDDQLPIPRFNWPTDKPGQREAADILRDAMIKLRRHICNKPTNVTEDWKEKYRELVVRMIVAQHEVVWATAGDFTDYPGNGGIPAAEKLFQRFSNNWASMQRLFERRAETDPVHHDVLMDLLNRYRVKFNEFSLAGSQADFGRSIRTVYAMRAFLAELDSEMSAPAAAKFGISPGVYNSIRDAANKGLGDTHELIYQRAIREINNRLLPTAPGVARFIIYYPSGNDPYFSSTWRNSTLSERVAERVAATIGKRFDLEIFSKLDGVSFDEAYPNIGFDSTAQKALFGNCYRAVVRIVFVESRRADADKAATLLRQENFEIQLRAVPPEATRNHTGRIYYQQNGSRHEATSIGLLLKDIDNLVAEVGPSSRAANPPDYALWLSPKGNQLPTTTTAEATPVGPTPYLSQADSPWLGFITAGTIYLETFEDGLLNTPGVTSRDGGVYSGDIVDSVERGERGEPGHSWFSPTGSLTFTFQPNTAGELPVYVGIVWTDGEPGNTTFEAYGPHGKLLVKIEPVAMPDSSLRGEKEEDRFVGVISRTGVAWITLKNAKGGIEVDHLQYGNYKRRQ